MVAIVLGRFISGVHWFSDILGGIFISLALLSSFYTVISSFTHKKVVVEKEEKEEDSLPIPIKEEAIYEI